MEKTAKITELEDAVGNFNYDGKTFFNHSVKFDNGDSGNFSNTKENSGKQAGDTCTYTITPNGKYPAKIKMVNPNTGTKPFTPKQEDPEKQLMIVRQSCIGYAVNLYAGLPESDKIAIKKPSDAIKLMAASFVDFVLNGTKVQEINK